MRRWLSMLLLVLMPFQFCWAAAAACCEHESGREATHFEHHPHEQAQPDAGSGAAFEMADCHFHCHCMAALPLFTGLPVIASASPVLHWTAADALAPVPSRPERPQWTGPA